MPSSPVTAKRIVAMTRYRVILVGLFLGVCTLARLFGLALPGAGLALLTGWVLSAAVLSVVAHRIRERRNLVERLSTAQHAIDITILTAIYWYAGGGWWMSGAFYAFPLFFASMSSPRRHAITLALYASAMFAALLFVQVGGGTTLHPAPFLGLVPRGVTVGLATITAIMGAVTMLLMAVLPERFVAFAQRSAERHRVLLDASQEGVWTVAGNGRTEHVNARIATMLGRPRATLQGERLLDLAFDERSREALQASLERGLRGEFDVSEQQLRHADGSARWMRMSLNPIVARRRGRDGVLAMFSDVTERRRAEEALELSEASARSFVENAPYGIYRSTLDGHFLAVNPALVRLLGYDSEQELLAVNIASDVYVDAGDRAMLTERAFRQEEIEPVELQWKRRDGAPVTVRLGFRRVSDAQDAFVYWEGYVEDVSELRLAERALRQKDEQLRLAQRLEAVGQLAGGVAHDFNNLMTVVKVTSDLLLEELSDDALRADVQEIRRAADSAAALTRQLLAFSRRQVLQPRVLDVGIVVNEMQPMLSRLVDANVSVAVAPAPHPAFVSADPGQLEQVFMNLVVNARDAMPDGGVVRIAMGAVVVVESDDRGMPAELVPGEYVTVSVSDTGTGIDVATQARIFEPFFTTKPQGAGTGLGLSTVYGIVQQSGGQISVQSHVGQGTTFTIYLPAVALPVVVPSEVATTSEPTVEHARPAAVTVLLVEDQGPVRLIARRVLEREGWEVLEAEDGVDALRKWGAQLDEIDVLLTDVVMPHMGGRMLAERLRALRPDLPIVFMSGFTDGALGDRDAITANAGFVAKPFASGALARAVQQALVGGGASIAREAPQSAASPAKAGRAQP